MKKFIITLAFFQTFACLTLPTGTIIDPHKNNIETFFLIKQIIKQEKLKKTPASEKIKHFYCLPQNKQEKFWNKIIQEYDTYKSIIEDDVHVPFLKYKSERESKQHRGIDYGIGLVNYSLERELTGWHYNINTKIDLNNIKIDYDFYFGLDRGMIEGIPLPNK